MKYKIFRGQVTGPKGHWSESYIVVGLGLGLGLGFGPVPLRYFRNYETERCENLTQSWERKMQFLDALR